MSSPFVKKGFSLIAWLGVVVIALVSLSGCSAQPERIDVAYSPFEHTALVWIAEDQGFFEREPP